MRAKTSYNVLSKQIRTSILKYYKTELSNTVKHLTHKRGERMKAKHVLQATTNYHCYGGSQGMPQYGTFCANQRHAWLFMRRFEQGFD